jgi:DNA-binding MarR family transcriptional regulator
MNDEDARILLEEVRQMRKLLELLAEPAISQRDAKLRDELRRVVGSSSKKEQAVLLMDGSRTQAQIVAETSVHQGDLSTMVGRLDSAGLLEVGRKQPKLAIPIPLDFFNAIPEPKRR